MLIRVKRDHAQDTWVLFLLIYYMTLKFRPNVRVCP